MRIREKAALGLVMLTWSLAGCAATESTDGEGGQRSSESAITRPDGGAGAGESSGSGSGSGFGSGSG